METKSGIETRGLTKFYGSVRGIEDLDLEVRRGEVFGFLGPNGSGKTTTIRLLLNLIQPTHGGGSVLGMDMVRDSLGVRRACGVVAGEPAFYGSLTGRRHMDLIQSYHARGNSRAAELAEALELNLDRPVRTYSRGMKQKLAIIQGMAHAPDVLIMDEPTLGLDPLVQQTFYRILAEERDRGVTVFLSSHILSEVERACDRVAIVRDGRLAAVLDVGELHRHRVRRMDVTLERDATADEFRLDEVEVVRIEGRHVELRVSGHVGELIRHLGTLPVQDVVFPEATLEDTFTAFYAGEEETS